MAFDPDAYLQKKTGGEPAAETAFDPDAYLVSKGVKERPRDIGETFVPPPEGVPFPPSDARPKRKDPYETTDKIMAGVAGFSDVATMGLGDETAAGMSAAGDWLLDKTGIHDMGDMSFTDMYRQRLGQGQAARERLATQYPKEFQQGEITGIGTQLLSPAGVTKSVGGQVGRLKQFADKKMGDVVDAASAAVQDLPIGRFAGKYLPGGSEVAVKQKLADKASAAAREASEKVSEVAGKQYPSAQAEREGLKRAEQLGKESMDAQKAAEAAQKAVSVAKKEAAGLRTVLPRNVEEAVGAALGYATPIPGGAVGGIHAVRQGRQLAEGTKAYEFAKKYGPDIAEWAARGHDAVISNIYIRQQQDPEFREAYSAAKKEAAQ